MAAFTSSSDDTDNNYHFDIFINHRGPDVKKTFASHLYRRLITHGLRVFLDNQELQEGENLTSQIKGAIASATVHVAIFSATYAESKWCLDELLLILESGAPLIPVFYGVRPANLRWTHGQDEGVYARALHNLEKKRTYDCQPRYNSTTVEKWRNALSSVSEISGLDLEAFKGDEGALLDKVIECVLKRVKKPQLDVAKYPVGLDEKAQDFERTVLSQQRRGVQVVGITGLGGVGKTTLAKELFNRKSSNYSKSYFVFDVRENAKNSLHSLQRKLLNGLIQLDHDIDSVPEGKRKLRKYLSGCRVLMVLDDIDHADQVDALLPLEVLHPESLILITTRDKNVLARSGLPESSIYQLTGLNAQDSRKLFCSYAFHQPFPLSGFEYLVDQFLMACQELPLSLKVFGGLLYGNQDKYYWEEQLDRLEQTLPNEIQSTLQISYDALERDEKQIFLDIACFFIGVKRDTAIKIWEGSGWKGYLGFQTLQRKCLVEIDMENNIIMHDHLRDLGRDLAKEPALPRRLWRGIENNDDLNQHSSLADKHLKNARALLGSQEPNEIYSALNLLDAALDLCPGWDKALELKARAFLYLGKFRDVANMLQEYIPSLRLREIVPSESPPVSKEMLREQMKLLPSYEENDRWRASVLLRSFSVSKLKKKYLAVLSRRCEREEWRYLILGQACCHLGMMEDALVLLQSGKRAAAAAIRRESMTLNDDSFCSENSSSELEIVNHLLGNIKFLLRRKTAAMAALDAGLYSESARHFSKIVDGRRGTPQGFIAECYMLRATAYQAAGRVTDSIADCNRTLALDPTCNEALTTRASLFETARCFSESLQDLEHVRLLYETILRQQKFPGPVWKHQNLNYRDVHGNLQILNSKILTMKQRLTSPYTVDYYTLIGLKRGCTRADVERAHMLLCLRHTPDKASQFVDRCEFVDERDIDTVKYQARMSTLMLYKLLQKAYTYIMTSIMEEEAEKQKKLRANEVKQEEPDGQVARVQCLQVRGEPSVDIKVEINPSDYCPESEASNIRATSSGPDINVVNGELQQFFLATSSATDWTLMNTTSREAHVPRMSDTSEFSIYTSAKEDSRLQEMADTSAFQAVSCKIRWLLGQCYHVDFLQIVG